MKKNILKILIISLFLAPFILQAYTPSFLSFSTDSANNITQTTATLHGTGTITTTYQLGCTSFEGYSTRTGIPCNTGVTQMSPITAYFRYSKAVISPIFCNDIYGTNMVSTGDIHLGASFTKDGKGNNYTSAPFFTPGLGSLFNSTQETNSFYQQITGLSPNTTYYYCAILSNKENISYGGESAVKSFHTNCYDTTVETKSVKNIKSTSAQLSGSYCSPKTNSDGTITNEKVKTYFQYREAKLVIPTGENVNNGCPTGWTGVYPACVASWVSAGEQTYNMDNNANLYGDIKFGLSGLKPNTEYQFRATVKNITTSGEEKIFPAPQIINFTTTNSSSASTSGGGSRDTTTSTTTTTTTTTTPTTTTTTTTTTTNESGIWTTDNEGTSGTWGTGTGSGTWTTTSGTGGTGSVTWVGLGNGLGTWTSSTGSGTWTTTSGTSSTGTGTWTNLVLGQTSTPPSDAIVRYHEGIETVFTRQIIKNSLFAKTYGYQEGTNLQTFAEDLSHTFAKAFGYIDSNGQEIRVSFPDIAAYQLQLIGNRLTVYEYFDNKIVDIRNLTTVFKDASSYEYYFQK
ncbi:MAG: hypothetical protein WC447_02690 [Candidatus Paceibacterota bacterium]